MPLTNKYNSRLNIAWKDYLLGLLSGMCLVALIGVVIMAIRSGAEEDLLSISGLGGSAEINGFVITPFNDDGIEIRTKGEHKIHANPSKDKRSGEYVTQLLLEKPKPEDGGEGSTAAQPSAANGKNRQTETRTQEPERENPKPPQQEEETWHAITKTSNGYNLNHIHFLEDNSDTKVGSWEDLLRVMVDWLWEKSPTVRADYASKAALRLDIVKGNPGTQESIKDALKRKGPTRILPASKSNWATKGWLRPPTVIKKSVD